MSNESVTDPAESLETFLGWVAESYEAHAKMNDIHPEEAEAYMGSAEMARAHLNKLRSKPVANGVEVKPLEWKDGWGCSTAKSCVGVYQVKSRPSDSAVDVTLANGASVWSTWASVAEKGKAAAEADYRQRILSALLSSEPQDISRDFFKMTPSQLRAAIDADPDGAEVEAGTTHPEAPKSSHPMAVTEEMVERVRSLEDACNQARLALAGMVGIQSALDKLDCRPLGVSAALTAALKEA